jgi:hypothetical protein
MTEYGSPRPRASNEQQSGASELLELAIEAHGHARWREATLITATVSSGGLLWASRGHPGAFDDVTVTIDAHAQHSSMARLTGPDRRGVFTPDRVAIENTDGELLEERQKPARLIRPIPRHPLGRPTPRVLRRLRDVDLPDGAVPPRPARLRC